MSRSVPAKKRHAPKTRLPENETVRARRIERSLALPRINLTDRQLCDLELILTGAFSPLTGFLNEKDYRSVLEQMRLADGSLWPMPVVLDQPGSAPFRVGDTVVLCDRYGQPIATMAIESVYQPDKKREVQLVFGTTDVKHPGVQYLFYETGDLYLGGTIEGIRLPERHDFADLRKTPQELHEYFERQGIGTVVGFQTRNPIHRAHFQIMKDAAEQSGAHVLMHPVVGLTKEGDIDYVSRVRAYRHVHQNYMQDFATLALLQLAMRMGGPREALWHAIIRKNHGCTHFIIGRDHAGPGIDSKGKPFYGPYAAQELVRQYADEIGITLMTPKEMRYLLKEKRYVPEDQVPEGAETLSISGTKLRAMLRAREEVPVWFTFPEVAAELGRAIEREDRTRGFTIFFTGLSGAGKSTIARIVYTKLLELHDRPVTLLDGDVVRQHLSKGLGFSREDRNTNIERIGFVAEEITKHGGIALCAAIAPYAEARDRNRSRISKYGRYIEVFVSAPLAVCQKRDPKALYRKVKEGQLKHFTGLDDPYEEPKHPDLVLDTAKHSAPQCAERLLQYLRTEKLLPQEE